MSLTAGTRLGAYEILAALGAGGMGEVYRARDPRLGRDVAIKLLPAAFTAEPDRLRRFEQEARAAAALNHPNILTVHEIGTHDDRPFLVSEVLEGETLRGALKHGALQVRKAIDYAIQMCRGLSAAHDKGIVHRDLKPENVFVTEDGRIKILDFGLAKLIEAPHATGASTIAAPVAAATAPGVVFGTVGYMSPEQVRGHAVDQRSDIFSFGAILYELLSGRRAFAGDSAADTLSDILVNDPPQLLNRGRNIPSGVDRIVHHCLEKQPARRFQSAADVALALEAITLNDESAAPSTRASSGRTTWAKPVGLLATAAAGALLGAGAIWLTDRPPTSPSSDRVLLTDAARLTLGVGFSDWPSWSPPGKLFAFSSNRTGNFEIYIRRVEGGQEVNTTNDPADDVQPAISPDGTSIAFVSTRSSRTPLVRMRATATGDYRTYGGDLWVAPVLGGQPRRLAENANFPAWRPDGRAIAYVTGMESHRAIVEAPVDGGTPKDLLAASSSTWEIVRIRYAPQGGLTFETTDRKVLALPSSGGPPYELLVGQSHAWTANGRLFYINEEAGGGTRLSSAAIETQQGKLGVLSASVALVLGLLRDLAVSSDGRYVLASEVQESLNVTKLSLAAGGGAAAGPEEELSFGRVRDGYSAVSPDSRRVLLLSDRLGKQELWTLDLESRHWTRVPVPEANCAAQQASWAPDGKQVAAVCDGPDGVMSLWLIALDGSGRRQVASGKAGLGAGNLFCEFSADGRQLLYAYIKDGFNQIFILDLTSGRERQLTTSRSDKYEGKWSPDGRWVAFSSNAGGALQVWRVSAEGGEEQPVTSGSDRIRHKFYAPDGRWIYVQPNHGNIFRRPVSGGPLERVTNFPESGLFIDEPAISPDGRFLVYSRSRGGSSLWLLTLGLAITPASDRGQ